MSVYYMEKKDYLRRMSTGRRTCCRVGRTCCGCWTRHGWQGQRTCAVTRRPLPSPPAARLCPTHTQNITAHHSQHSARHTGRHCRPTMSASVSAVNVGPRVAGFITPSPPVDNIWTMMTVCRIRGKIIGTVQCCVVYYGCTQWYAHIYEQLLQLTVCFWFRFRFRFALIALVCLSVFIHPFCSCVVWFCCVRFSFLNTKSIDGLGRTSLKWTILCWVRRKSVSVKAVFMQTTMCLIQQG